MIPRWTSKETGLLLSHGMFLMLRTYLSLVVARLDGEIVRDLVAGNGKSFIWGIVKVRKTRYIYVLQKLSLGFRFTRPTYTFITDTNSGVALVALHHIPMQ